MKKLIALYLAVIPLILSGCRNETAPGGPPANRTVLQALVSATLGHAP